MCETKTSFSGPEGSHPHGSKPNNQHKSDVFRLCVSVGILTYDTVVMN